MLKLREYGICGRVFRTSECPKKKKKKRNVTRTLTHLSSMVQRREVPTSGLHVGCLIRRPAVLYHRPGVSRRGELSVWQVSQYI